MFSWNCVWAIVIVLIHHSVGSAESPSLKIQFYKDRYQLNDLQSKLVSNRGQAIPGKTELPESALRGVRNFRVVLPGILYRGGANNVFRNPPRDNRNPLPIEGMKGLCQEGFTQAYYLYSRNFKSAPSSVSCRKTDGQISVLKYDSNPLPQGISKILKEVHSRILNPDFGPIYAHCWNGWHASGFISAVALRQFCSWSADQAVRYWEMNADGAANDPAYKKIRGEIRRFQASPELSLSEDQKSQLCVPFSS